MAAAFVDDKEITESDKVDVTSFQVGEEVFRLTEEQLSKIPFLEGLASGHFSEAQQDGIVKVEVSPSLHVPLVKVALEYVKRGRAKLLFTRLPDGYKPSAMFQQLDFLLIEKPNGTVKEYNDRMKNVKTEYDKYGRNVSANRSDARDAVVELCWRLNDQHNFDDAMEQRIYNLVVFAVSHPRTYYPALRKHVYGWYKDNFLMTPNQELTLEGFLTKFDDHDPSERWDPDSDKTSSGGSSLSDYCGYNSDADYYFNSD